MSGSVRSLAPGDVHRGALDEAARMGLCGRGWAAGGEVSSQGATRLRVRFDGNATPVSIRPHWVRMVMA